MTESEAIEQLKAQQGNKDREAAHGAADTIICELLHSLGYEQVVKEWELVDTWYA